MKKSFSLASLSLSVLLLVPVLASADMFTFDLNVINFGGYTGPYATVTVNQSGNIADLTFTSLTNGNYVYLFGDGSSAAVNVNSTAYSVSNLTSNNTYSMWFTTPTLTPNVDDPANPPPAPQVDGWGRFNTTIDSSDGYASASSVIGFRLTNNLGDWANAASVLVDNADGYFAAAHIMVGDLRDLENGALITGYAANGTPQVPEPATMLLFGTGMIGLAGIARKKRS